MLHRLALAAVLAFGLSSHAYAQQLHAQGQRVMLVDEAGKPISAANALPVSGGGSGGSGGTVTQGTSPWVISGNSTANGAGNPIFVQLTNPGSTGSVTAAGTNGSLAQAVQGINGGIPLPIQGGNGTAVKTDGSAVTQPVSAATLPLPTGAATAANQATEISSLTAIANRAVVFSAALSATAVAANGTVSGPWRTIPPGGNGLIATRLNAYFSASVAGTGWIDFSTDGGASNVQPEQSVAVAAGTQALVSAPVFANSYRVRFVAGATAGAVTAFDSATAN